MQCLSNMLQPLGGQLTKFLFVCLFVCRRVVASANNNSISSHNVAQLSIWECLTVSGGGLFSCFLFLNWIHARISSCVASVQHRESREEFCTGWNSTESVGRMTIKTLHATCINDAHTLERRSRFFVPFENTKSVKRCNVVVESKCGVKLGNQCVRLNDLGMGEMRKNCSKVCTKSLVNRKAHSTVGSLIADGVAIFGARVRRFFG